MPADANRLSLSIDQACGTKLDAVLEARRRMAAESGRLEDLVPLGRCSLIWANSTRPIGSIDRALREYQRCFTVCRGLGLLSARRFVGRTRTRNTIEPGRAWYRKAIEYLPCYVKARVHLAEIYLQFGRTADAEALLTPGGFKWRPGSVVGASPT